MKTLGKNKEQGQSLVEVAISLPIILLILSGLLDLGRIYYLNIALEEAAAEAAVYLAISPDCPVENSLERCENPNNALYRAVNAGNDEFDPALAEWNIPFSTAKETAGWRSPFGQDANGSASSDCSTIGCSVIIQVRYPFEFYTPGMQAFLNSIDNTITLNVQASQIIVYEQVAD